MTTSEHRVLTGALAWAAAGIPVFPCTGKTPNTAHGFKDATTDEATIRRWWHSIPHNIGIPTGAVSGIVALDVDGDAGEKSLAALELDLPATAEQRTPHGRHLLFAHSGAFVQGSVGALGEGLDIRGDGQYIIAAPSAGYRLRSMRDPARLPEHLATLASAKPERAQSNGATPTLRIAEGKRNDALARLGGQYRALGWDEGDIEERLQRDNLKLCDPPIDASEVTTIARSVAGYAAGTGTVDAIAFAKAEPGAVPVLDTLTAVDLDNMDIPPIRWVVEPILTEGATLFAAKPKRGKSWWCLNMALAVHDGGLVAGEWVAGEGESLYLALEDGNRRVKSRLKKLLKGEAPPPGVHFRTDWPRFGSGGLEHLDAWLNAHRGVRLVIIDTLKQIRAPRKRNGDSYDEDYEAIEGLRKLGEKYAVAIVIVHHLRKAESEDPFDLVSGTLGLTAAADTTWVLHHDRGQDELCVTGRDVDRLEVAVKFNEVASRWSVIGSADESRGSPVQAQVRDLLQESVGGLTPTTLAEVLGCSPQKAGKHLHHLVENGHARRLGRSLYVSLHSVVGFGGFDSTGPEPVPNGPNPGHKADSEPVFHVVEPDFDDLLTP